ncbi:MAG: putative selenate ABC transporter substrate-binding protein [Gemmatimonadota bacterium]
MKRPSSPFFTGLFLVTLHLTAACGADGDEVRAPLAVGAIPDQDPEVLQRTYGRLVEYLEAELDVDVVYRPVTDYSAAVSAFRVGDLDLVWFGGLTGVQARLQVPGAEALVQRAQDQEFRSVFIARRDRGLAPFEDLEGLEALRGRTFTFGSESSTSGRLMPQHFLAEAGVIPDDFRGEPGFSGSHDATIQLVEAGSYEAGALNEQVWDARVRSGAVDTTRVVALWRTPPYHDYHWVVRPALNERYGSGFTERIREAFLMLDDSDPMGREVLELFGAERFVPTRDENYAQIEAVGRELGRIR